MFRFRALLFAVALCILAIPSLDLHAQGGGFLQDRLEQIEAMRVAYITREANLTPEESQVFWPVYNEYLRETDESRREAALDAQDAKRNFAVMTDAEVERALDQMISYKQEEVELQRKYLARFKQILPIRKVAMVYKAERGFKRYLLQQLRARQGAAGGR